MQIYPRYFERKGREKPLFSDWPLYRNGSWSQMQPPNEEPPMTEKECVQQEIEAHMH